MLIVLLNSPPGPGLVHTYFLIFVYVTPKNLKRLLCSFAFDYRLFSGI